MKRFLLNITLPFTSTILLLVLIGCSNKKNSFFHRAYHNTTARYNGFFNSKESIKSGLKELSTSHKEDYTKPLPIFIDGNKDELSGIQPYMVKVVDKSSNVIDRHSINLKNIEYCRWIDENYYLIGKAHFFKSEFDDAITNLEYVARRYDKSATRHYAKLWAARTYIEMEEYDKAQIHLDELKNSIKEELYPDEEEKKDNTDKTKASTKKKPSSKSKSKKKKKSYKKKKKASKKKKKAAKAREKRKKASKKKSRKKKGPTIKEEKFPKRIEGETAMVQADLYMRQKKYPKAIDELELAISKIKKRKTKTRLYFILAQLYQLQKNPSKASYYYSRTIKNRPIYEMEFYSKINRALNFQEGTGKKNPIKQELMKMLKDEKNVEYKDQIYFALADIEFKEGNEDKGIEYLIESTRYSLTNNRQKGLSFLRLANTYFSKREYELAKNYYDSTVAFLPKEHKSFEAIADRSEHLTDLVKNLNTIQREDSLQKIASLSEEKRNEFIDNLIFEQEEAERKKEEEQANNSTIVPGVPNPSPTPSGSGSNWYFYNQKMKSMGFAEFKKKWGNRPLEDNWRRKNKSSVQPNFDDDKNQSDQNSTSDPSTQNVSSEAKKNKYLKDLPLTEDKLNKSNQQILDAYYNAGIIYKEKLRDDNQARISFESLIERYDSSEYHLPVYYQLYRLYLTRNDIPKINHYKELISHYPNSEYWKIIVDPNYRKNLEADRIEDEENYTEVFNLYREKRYSEVISCSNYYLEGDSNNYFRPQFEFITALSYSGLNEMDTMVTLLEDIATKYPTHEVGQQAKELLNLMSKNSETNLGNSTDTIPGNIDSTGNKNEKFSYKEDEEHFFVLVCPDTIGDINNIKAVLSDFNQNYFLDKHLQVESNYINKSDQALLIKQLENGEEALNYFSTYKNEQKLLKDLKDRYEYFVISKNNFTTLFQEKNLEEYLIFFQEKYFN